MPSPDPAGAAPQPGGHSRRPPPPKARSGRAAGARGSAERERAAGAAGGSGSTPEDGARRRLPAWLGKSFPDPVSFRRAGGGPAGESPEGALPRAPGTSPSPGWGSEGRGVGGGGEKRGSPSLLLAGCSGLGNLPSVCSQSHSRSRLIYCFSC